MNIGEIKCIKNKVTKQCIHLPRICQDLKRRQQVTYRAHMRSSYIYIHTARDGSTYV